MRFLLLLAILSIAYSKRMTIEILNNALVTMKAPKITMMTGTSHRESFGILAVSETGYFTATTPANEDPKGYLSIELDIDATPLYLHVFFDTSLDYPIKCNVLSTADPTTVQFKSQTQNWDKIVFDDRRFAVWAYASTDTSKYLRIIPTYLSEIGGSLPEETSTKVIRQALNGLALGCWNLGNAEKPIDRKLYAYPYASFDGDQWLQWSLKYLGSPGKYNIITKTKTPKVTATGSEYETWYLKAQPTSSLFGTLTFTKAVEEPWTSWTISEVKAMKFYSIKTSRGDLYLSNDMKTSAGIELVLRPQKLDDSSQAFLIEEVPQ